LRTGGSVVEDWGLKKEKADGNGQRTKMSGRGIKSIELRRHKQIKTGKDEKGKGVGNRP